MKRLYFENAGMKGTGANDLDNCRMRTAFSSTAGKQVYLEIGKGYFRYQKGKKIISEDGYLKIAFAFYITGDSDDCNTNKVNITLADDIKYCKKSVLNLVNSIGGDFTDIECFDNGYFVHGEKYNTYNMGDEWEPNKPDLDNISIIGHRGTWYKIDTFWYKGLKYYLLEHEQLGDETAGIIVDEKFNIVLENVYNGKLDLIEYLE